MRVALLFFLAVCVVSALGQRTAVDLWFNEANGAAPGYVSLPATTLGHTGAIAFEIQAFLNRDDGQKNSLIYYGHRTNVAEDIEVFVQGTKIGLRLGNSVITSTYTLPIIGTWTYIVVNIQNDGGVASAQLFVNGVDATSTLSNSARFSVALTSSQRQFNFLGRSGGVGEADAAYKWRGLVDMFFVWGKTLSLQTVQNNAALGPAAPAFVGDGLINRILFSETSGLTAAIQRGTAAQEFSGSATLRAIPAGSLPTTVFTGGAFVGWSWCNGWGDPHWTDLAGSHFDTIHTPGYFNDLQCKNSAQQTVFLVSTFHMTGCCWGGNTVIRALNVRLGSTIVQWAGAQAMDNGIKGPWVYKNIPEGVAAASVNFQTLAVSAGSSIVVPGLNGQQSGIVVDLDPSGSSFRIYGVPYGYVKIVDTGNYANMDIYINEATCLYTPGESVCKGGRHPVGEWVFTGEPITPVPLSLPPPVAEPPPPDCTTIQPIAERSCKRCFPNWSTSQEIQYQQCLTDVCATGDPYCPPPVCVPGEPCCQCASTGTCLVNSADNSTSCTCDQGYGGPDCSQVLDLVTLSLDTATTKYDGRPYVITPYDLKDAVSTKVDATVADLASANNWVVKNSLLAYVGTVARMAGNGVTTYSQHLYVVGDATSFPSGLTHSVGVEYITNPDGGATTLTSASGTIGSGASVTAGTAAMPTTVRLATASTGVSGFVLPNLPQSWCIRLTTDATFGDNQVLVGSGNIRGQLEVIKVVESDQSFTICGKKLSNPCADITNCEQCAINDQCGWCRTTGTCRYGRPSGPTDGTLCTAWAFTFNTDISRRITESYGYAVSPVDTTVILSTTAVSTLPIEIKVDMAYRFTSAWDVNIMFPRGPSNNAELTNMRAAIGSISDFLLASYTNIALSVSAYASRAGLSATPETDISDSNVYKPVFPLASPTSSTTFQGLLNALQLASSADPAKAQLALAISRASATQHPGWRTNARHMLIIFVTHPDDLNSANVAQARSDLLSFSVLPVFVATQNVKAFYQDYVKNQLKFGLVIDYTAPTSMPQLVDRAMADAGKSISLTVDENNAGRIDFSAGKLDSTNRGTLALTGLQQRMKARAVFPVSPQQGNNDHAVVLAPGFGQSNIDAVASDRPYTNGREVRVTVDPPLTPYSSNGQKGTIVYLTGKVADVLKSNALVQAHFKSVTKGAIYQFDENFLINNGLVSSLTPIPSGSYTPITDVQGRVIYVPPNNNFGDAEGAAYATITYKVRDECADSADGTIPIFVEYANNESPTTEHTAASTNENQAVKIDFVGVDSRSHLLKLVVTQPPTNTQGNTSILHGSLYTYTDACWTAVSANFRDVSACGAALVAGSEVAALRPVEEITLPDGAKWWNTYTSAIYVPHEYANSEAKPPVYMTLPTMEYKFVQIALPADNNIVLESERVLFAINIAAVNQAPSAQFQASFRTWLSWNPNYVVPDASVCTTTDNEGGQCVFAQNLGSPYPDQPIPESIYLFGADLEQESLQLEVVSVTCASDAQIDSVAFASRLVAGGKINDRDDTPFAPNGWAPVVNFKPAQDGAADNYCAFTYRVFDGELYSADTNTVSIKITFTPQPPRSENYRVFAPLITPTPFEFSARSVNDMLGNAVQAVYVKSVVVKSCDGDVSSVLVIDGQTINCGALPVEIQVADNNADVDVVSGKQHTFSGSWTPTAASVNGFTVIVAYKDTHQPTALVSDDYTITFSYRHVNVGPQFRVGVTSDLQPEEGWTDNLESKLGITLASTIGGASLNMHARDADSGEGDVTVRVSIITAQSGDIDHIRLGFANNGLWAIEQADRVYSLTAPIATVESELSTMSVDVNGVSQLQFNLSWWITDYGAEGACSPDNVNPCAKTAKALTIVKASTPTNVAAIGLAAGAGGAALAAAAAAAIAWRALREPPTESYNPWEMDEANEGTVMNPLFESAGKSGDNPMFESAGNGN